MNNFAHVWGRTHECASLNRSGRFGWPKFGYRNTNVKVKVKSMMMLITPMTIVNDAKSYVTSKFQV